MKSTTIIAFDQHAATTVAGVLLPGHRTPALHTLTSDVPTAREISPAAWPPVYRDQKGLVEASRRVVAGANVAAARARQTHRAYLRAVDEVVARIRAVEEDLRALLDLDPLRPRVQQLRCFRGIDDLTALTIAAELGGSSSLRHRAEHHGVRRSGPIRALKWRETRAGRHHQNRQRPSPPGPGRVGLALSPSSIRQRHAPCPAARSPSGGDCPRVDGPAAVASSLSAAGRARQT
jgi:hypothetical protein